MGSLHVSGESSRYYVLYDATSLISNVRDEELSLKAHPSWLATRLISIIEPHIIAMVSADKTSGTQWNASTVTRSAGNKGYGPLVYDIAMAIEGGLVPDREIVSQSAKSVWKRYFNRSDVKHKPLDDIEDPRTPSKEDDAELHSPKTDTNPLNNAYFLKSYPNTHALAKNDERAKSLIVSLTGAHAMTKVFISASIPDIQFAFAFAFAVVVIVMIVTSCDTPDLIRSYNGVLA